VAAIASRAADRLGLGPLATVVERGARDRRYRSRVLSLLGLALGPDLKDAFHFSNTEFVLVASAGILQFARRYYPREVAAASASGQANAGA
jgi:hypothetical protein